MKREEWWGTAIIYPDGVCGQRRFDTRESALSDARANELLGYGHGNERTRGRIVVTHTIREIEDYEVSDETRARIDAEDAAYEAKRKKK